MTTTSIIIEHPTRGVLRPDSVPGNGEWHWSTTGGRNDPETTRQFRSVAEAKKVWELLPQAVQRHARVMEYYAERPPEHPAAAWKFPAYLIAWPETEPGDVNGVNYRAGAERVGDVVNATVRASSLTGRNLDRLYRTVGDDDRGSPLVTIGYMPARYGRPAYWWVRFPTQITGGRRRWAVEESNVSLDEAADVALSRLAGIDGASVPMTPTRAEAADAARRDANDTDARRTLQRLLGALGDHMPTTYGEADAMLEAAWRLIRGVHRSDLMQRPNGPPWEAATLRKVTDLLGGMYGWSDDTP